jgi:hypothetical protein
VDWSFVNLFLGNFRDYPGNEQMFLAEGLGIGMMPEFGTLPPRPGFEEVPKMAPNLPVSELCRGGVPGRLETPAAFMFPL